MEKGVGGLFRQWKIQRVRQADTLPEPPEGMKWLQNPETKAWKLVPAQESSSSSEEEELYLHEEAPRLMVVQGGPLIVDQNDGESKEGDDWSLLSGRLSSGSLGGVAIMVPRGGGGGSTNFSITSLDSASANLQHPYRVQRTHSSSTIDSTEGTLSSQVTGILGVDYVEHVILPTDTFQGICLAYKISATRLRQVNHFSGSNLSIAPKKLIIPLTKKALRSGFIRVQDKESREYKLHAFLAEVSSVKEGEAKSYLELNDWVLEDAIHAAWDDGEWQEEDGKETEPPGKHGGDICIKVNLKNGVPIGFCAHGAGDTVPYGKFDNPNGKMASVASGVDMTIYEGVPTSVNKNVSAKDVYQAAPQHNGFGVEMQSLAKKPDPPSK